METSSWRKRESYTFFVFGGKGLCVNQGTSFLAETGHALLNMISSTQPSSNYRVPGTSLIRSLLICIPGYCILKLSLYLELLSEKSKFCHQIECLITSIDRINNDPIVKERLEKLIHSIESCVENCGRVYIFGSRMYGIAKDDSDVDLYFDTGKFIINVKCRTYYSIL